VANLVKMVSAQGMWYEEISSEKAEALERALGVDFGASIEQVTDILGQEGIPLGILVEPEDLKPEDRIIGTCHL